MSTQGSTMQLSSQRALEQARLPSLGSVSELLLVTDNKNLLRVTYNETSSSIMR